MDELILQEKESEKVADPVSAENLPTLEEMMKAGLFLGRKSSKTHPKMKPFIFGVRNRSSIIDLEETLRLTNVAMEFVKTKIANNEAVLLVGTTPTAKNSVENIAKRLELPFVTERWLGGTLTNFNTLSKRISYFKKLKSDRESGKLDKYTKKERVDFNRKIEKMTTMFSGVENMGGLPSALFIIDVKSNLIAVREAKRLNIPVVGILNTDTDPDLVDYPVPANDRSKTSADWILARLEKAVEEGRAQAKEVGEAKKVSEEQQ